MNLNHKEILLEIYENLNTSNLVNIDKSIFEDIEIIGQNIERQTGVFTVLITLGIHKILHPEQDIRRHQSNMVGGFSGRSIDTKMITPTLKELKLPSMSESGWLTRSLEQPYPYDKDYNGKVGNKKVKVSFLKVVDYIQNNPKKCKDLISYLLNEGVKIRENNKVEISKISNPENITIETIIKSLNEFYTHNYHISGGSKLPVISFYTIYSILIKEVKRFEGCTLGELSSHTTSDKTSKSSGDIEIFFDDQVLESLEVKFEIEIDSHIVNRVLEKIYKFNPKRYYILTTLGIKENDYSDVIEKVHTLKKEHGCQLIINGLLPTLKYYLRLIENLEEFVTLFSYNIVNDKELKITHKQKWNELQNKYFQ
jgi:DNA (cytosine-5)-methyltransferase 1